MEERLYFLNSTNSKLCGILTDPTGDPSRPIIILSHGFNSSKESGTCISLAKKLNENGFSTFRFDFFAHGESEGNFEDLTVTIAVEDTLKAIELMKARGYRKIGLMGSSFGGLSSFIAASKSEDIYVLVQKAPVSSFAEVPTYMDKKLVAVWKKTGYRKIEGKKLKFGFYEDSMKNIAYDVAKKIKIPTFIIHGNRDLDVPVDQSIRISGLISDCSLEIVIGADHRFTKKDDFDRMINSIADYVVNRSA